MLLFLQIVSIKISERKFEDVVILDDSVARASTTGGSVGSPAAVQRLSPEAVQRFKSDCIDVLSTVDGHAIPLVLFTEQYLKVKNEPFLLANYNAKKMMHLIEAVPDVLQVGV